MGVAHMTVPLCLSFFLTHFSCSSVDLQQATVPARSLLLCGLSTGCRGISFFSDFGAHRGASRIPHFLAEFCPLGCLIEATSAWLCPVWAQLCPVVGLLDPAETSCVQHGTALSLFTDATPVAPHYQNFNLVRGRPQKFQGFFSLPPS